MGSASNPKVTHLSHADTAVIQADGVSRYFETPSERVFGVRKVDIEVKKGEFVCLMGPSGCGKSTLLSLLAGLDTPDEGRVHFSGQELSAASAETRASVRLKEIGMIFQQDQLIPEFTTLENVMFPLELLGWSRDDCEESALRALEKVGLTGLAKRFPSELSGGQRQRAGIARAIAGPRQAVIADEATGSLDHLNSLAIFELLRALADSGYAVIAATHDLSAATYAHRILRMSDGRILTGLDNSSPELD